VKFKLLSQVAALSSSVFDGAINLIRGATKKNLRNTLLKLKLFVLDESVFRVVSGHISIITLFSNPCVKPLLSNSLLTTKYFQSYLVKTFKKSDRRESLRCHYEYLIEHMNDAFFQNLIIGQERLWRKEIDGSIYTVSLDHCLDWPAEGDLKLVFAQNMYALCEVTFSIIPGKCVGSTAAHVLLIANVQGALGQINKIRQATKACNRITPPHLLVKAAESIATALQVSRIVGVSNDQHLWKTDRWSPDFAFDYDQFWESFPSARLISGLYEIFIPIPEKPLEDVKSNQRRRAMRKRELSAEISIAVYTAFSKLKREKPADPVAWRGEVSV
jgi:uncharacterized protein VirK/YbjX